MVLTPDQHHRLFSHEKLVSIGQGAIGASVAFQFEKTSPILVARNPDFSHCVRDGIKVCH
jgi:hypothetical protein